MPVIVLETRDFTGPLSLARGAALLSGCLTFSLVASLDPGDLSARPERPAFRTLCMFTWCLFFVLTLLVYVINIIQFHSLVPVSWKNLTVTVASLAALMALSAAVLLPWLVAPPVAAAGGGEGGVRPRPLAAAVASCLTALAYAAEALLIRTTQGPEQRGYMASVPGLLKVLQVWGGCQMVPLVAEGARAAGGGLGQGWQLWAAAAACGLCLAASLGTLAVVLGDCAGRCPVPFDRVLAGFGLGGVLLYALAAVLCVERLRAGDPGGERLVVMETVVVGVTLLAYTADLAFSVKLLRDRSHS